MEKMPKTYFAHSLIYTVKPQLININDLKPKFKKLIEDAREELKKDNLYIETIIKPIICHFRDDEKRTCLSFNFGYRLWCSDNTTEKECIDYQMEVNEKVVFMNGSLMLEFFGNNYSFVVFGLCNDHSYVQNSKPIKRTIVIGPKPHDMYVWYNNKPTIKEIAGTKYNIYESEQVEDKIIYMIFPKKYITLPSK